jgi:hypothetical protein
MIDKIKLLLELLLQELKNTEIVSTEDYIASLANEPKIDKVILRYEVNEYLDKMEDKYEIAKLWHTTQNEMKNKFGWWLKYNGDKLEIFEDFRNICERYLDDDDEEQSK